MMAMSARALTLASELALALQFVPAARPARSVRWSIVVFQDPANEANRFAPKLPGLPCMCDDQDRHQRRA